MLTLFRESYKDIQRRCSELIASSPEKVDGILQHQFRSFGIDDNIAVGLSQKLMLSPQPVLEAFLLRHHFEVADPGSARPYVSCLTLALSYFVGGFVALVPYLIVPQNRVLTGLWWSIGIMGVVLLVFGFLKTTCVRGLQRKDDFVAGLRGSLQMLAVGAIAAGAAVGLVMAIETTHYGN